MQGLFFFKLRPFYYIFAAFNNAFYSVIFLLLFFRRHKFHSIFAHLFVPLTIKVHPFRMSILLVIVRKTHFMLKGNLEPFL